MEAITVLALADPGATSITTREPGRCSDKDLVDVWRGGDSLGSTESTNGCDIYWSGPRDIEDVHPIRIVISHVQPMGSLIHIHEVSTDGHCGCGRISDLRDRHPGGVGGDGRRIGRGRRSDLRSLMKSEHSRCALIVGL